MPKKSDLIIKDFFSQIGVMLDSRFKTFETLIRGEIKASEDRIRRDMATKDDIGRLEVKLDKSIASQKQTDNRVSMLEERILVPS